MPTRHWKMLGAGASILFLIAWFLPVVKDGTTLAKGGIPGWEAFRVALSPIWPYENLSSDGATRGILSVLSALTNGWFLISLAAFTVWKRAPIRVYFWGLVLAALLNLQWPASIDDMSDLRVGYYAWVAAFVVLAVAAHLKSQSVPARRQ